MGPGKMWTRVDAPGPAGAASRTVLAEAGPCGLPRGPPDPGGTPGTPTIQERRPGQLPDELLPTLRDPQTFLLDRASSERVDVVQLDHDHDTIPWDRRTRDRPPSASLRSRGHPRQAARGR